MLFGIVENVNDPLKLGRVRVRVYGSHDNRQGDEYNIKEEDLAWSEVMMPGNTPAKSGVGHSVNLLVGTLVCGMFKDPANQEAVDSLLSDLDGTGTFEKLGVNGVIAVSAAVCRAGEFS